MDALYFRVSSDRQTTENQFDELITAARAGDPARDWERIRSVLGHSVLTETRTTRRGVTRSVYHVERTASAAERVGPRSRIDRPDDEADTDFVPGLSAGRSQ